jgi:short-subunit dehydrogenase
MSKPGEAKKLFVHAVETWKKIDVWVNNAGLSGGYRYLHEVPDTEIYSIINTNITGLLEACSVILPYFTENRGVLINMTGLGSDGKPAPYTTIYACTKAAVTNLTLSLAEEYKKYPVSIHAVMPGMMDTDFFKDIKVGKGLESRTKIMPVLIDAFGTPLETVGKNFAEIAAQEPGKKTGKIYNFIGGLRRLRGVFKMMIAGMTGKFRR